MYIYTPHTALISAHNKSTISPVCSISLYFPSDWDTQQTDRQTGKTDGHKHRPTDGTDIKTHSQTDRLGVPVC